MKNLKLPLLISLIAFLPLFSNGQKKDSLSKDSLSFAYISVNGGTSFLDSRVPFGSTLNISIQVPFHQSYFGFAGMMGYAIIPFSLNQFMDNLYNYYTYQGISKSNGKEFGLLAGMYASVPLHKFTFYINILAGAFECTSPGAIYSYEVGPPFPFYGTMDYKPVSVVAFGGDFTFSLRYRISKHICTNLNFDLLYLAPWFNSYEGYIDYYGSTNYVLNGSIHHSSSVGMANTTVGIGYLIGK